MFRTCSRLLAVAVAVAGSGSACVGEPGQLCDREQLSFALDDFVFDASHDVDPNTAGIQIDVVVRTSLAPGTAAELVVATPDDERVVDQRPVAGDDGVFVFSGVTLPLGPTTLTLRSQNGCRNLQSSREVFAYDEFGAPICRVDVPGASPASPHPILAGLQIDVTVATARPDMDVSLLVRDADSGDEQSFALRSGSDGTVSESVTVDPGTIAIRAICTWDLFPEPPVSSPSLVFVVDP